MKRQAGLSLLELVIIVSILTIILAAVAPGIHQQHHEPLLAASRELVEAARFARAEALRTRVPHGIQLNTSTDRIRVYRAPAGTPIFDVRHPIDHQPYDRQLDNFPAYRNVHLQSASFTFTDSLSSSDSLSFSADGIPIISEAGRDYMLTSASIILSYADLQQQIIIHPITGHVQLP